MTTAPFLPPLPELVRPLGEPSRYRLAGTLRHRTGDEVSDGYRTDLASVPRALHWLLPPDGPYEAAAVRHDQGCDLLNAGLPGRDSRTVDRDLRHDLRDLGMGVCRRWLMWEGVRLGALANPARRPGSAATLPGVALLLLLSFWLVIPTVVCTAAVAVLNLLEPACPAPPAQDPATYRHHEYDTAA